MSDTLNPTENEVRLCGHVAGKVKITDNPHHHHRNNKIAVFSILTYREYRKGIGEPMKSKKVNRVVVFWDDMLPVVESLQDGDLVSVRGQLESRSATQDEADVGCVVRPGSGMVFKIEEMRNDDEETRGS